MRSIGRIVLSGLFFVGVGLADAEDAQKLPRIGQVFGSNPVFVRPFDEGFREGLRDLGYVDGDNVIILPRYAHGDPARYPALLSELIALKVDVLLLANTVVPAAMQLTKTIPIVAPTMGDAVADGFAASFAHPGGNVTGGSVLGPETDAKRLALAKEVVPDLRRAVLMFEASGALALGANEFRTRADGVGVTLQLVGVRNLDEIESALKAMKRNRPQALFLWGTPMMAEHGFRVIAGSASYKVPVITDGREFAEAGALFTYNANYHEMWRRGALYVDRILKGAKPGDLPIEQPTKFELIINLRTAKALGITIPESLLQLADEIIR
jgi:putative ABC transport system substrate-binding protein